MLILRSREALSVAADAIVDSGVEGQSQWEDREREVEDGNEQRQQDQKECWEEKEGK